MWLLFHSPAVTNYLLVIFHMNIRFIKFNYTKSDIMWFAPSLPFMKRSVLDELIWHALGKVCTVECCTLIKKFMTFN